LPLVLPTIAFEDYETDDKFCDMYDYIQTDELTGNAGVSVSRFLTANQHIIGHSVP